MQNVNIEKIQKKLYFLQRYYDHEQCAPNRRVFEHTPPIALEQFPFKICY